MATLHPTFRSQPCWLAGVLAFAVFSLPALPYLESPADLWNHIQYAKSIHGASDITSPHFLFQVLLIAIHRLAGVSFEAAAVLVLAACFASMAVLIAGAIQRSAPDADPRAVVTATVLVLLASHVFAQTALKLNFYYGYVAPAAYHNPTQILSKALALAVMFGYIALVANDRSVWLRVALPLGIVLSATAKPSFLIAFLPTVVLVEAARLAQGRWRTVARNAALTILPGIVVLAAQFKLTFAGSNSGVSGIGFAPFLVYGGAADVLAKLPASMLFPVVATSVIAAQRVVGARLRFAWLLYAVGIVISLCLVETGPRLMQGNFAWTGQTVTFLLYVECVIALFAVQWRRAAVAWTAFTVHVAFGVLWFLAALLRPIGTFL